MKYIKKFSTETERSSYAITDDMVSYVEETDNVYIDELTKVASFKITLSGGSQPILPLYGFGASRTSTSTRSSIDKITINGKSIDINKLIWTSIFDSDTSNTGIFSKQAQTANGHDIYRFYNDTQFWFDFDNGIVRSVIDDSQITYNDSPVYCELADTYGIKVYINDGSDYNDILHFDGPTHQGLLFPVIEEEFQEGEYVVELYSKDNEVKFDFAGNCPRTDPHFSFTDYTITKNVTYIGKLSGSNTIQELTYPGTIAEFQAIEKIEKWNVYYTSPRHGDYKSVTVVHCTDGDLSV